jgi:hypothetical protein
MKFLKKDMNLNPAKSMDKNERIYHLEYPVGGIAQVRNAVLEQVDWAHELQYQDVDADTYRKFMCLLFTAMYALAPQGRVRFYMEPLILTLILT